jgi:hypothetical protein
MTVPKKRIMRRFSIDEISAVTSPAQKGARMVIMKRDGGVDAEKLAKGDYVLTDSVEGHQHLVLLDDAAELRGSGYTDGANCSDGSCWHIHPFSIDEMGNVVIGDAMNHGHMLATQSQNVEDLEESGLLGEHNEDGESTMGAGAGAGAEDDAGKGSEYDAGTVSGLAKRKFTAQERRDAAGTGAALPDGSYPIHTRADLENAIHAWGRAPESKRTQVARHIRSRAKTLGATDILPTEGPLAAALGRSKESDKCRKENDDMAKVEIDEGKLTEVIALASMSDVHKVHFGKLSGADRDAFMKADYAGRDAIVGKVAVTAAAADPATAEISKLAKRIDELAVQNDTLLKALDASKAVATETEAHQIVAKLEHLGMPVEDKVAMVKGILAMSDEKARKSALDALTSGRESFLKIAKQIGVGSVGNGTHSTAVEKLDALARERISKSESGIGYAQAYAAVLATPQGAALYEETVRH